MTLWRYRLHAPRMKRGLIHLLMDASSYLHHCSNSWSTKAMLLYTTPSTGDRIRLQEVRVLCWATPPKKKKKIVYTREWRGTWNHVEKKRDSYKWEWYPHRLFFWLFLFLFRGAQCHPSLKTTDWDRASRLEIAFCLAALCCCCLTHRRNAITTNILLLLLLLAYCRLENPTLLSPFLTSLLSSHRRWAESNYKSSFLIHFLVGFFFFSLFFYGRICWCCCFYPSYMFVGHAAPKCIYCVWMML